MNYERESDETEVKKKREEKEEEVEKNQRIFEEKEMESGDVFFLFSFLLSFIP